MPTTLSLADYVRIFFTLSLVPMGAGAIWRSRLAERMASFPQTTSLPIMWMRGTPGISHTRFFMPTPTWGYARFVFHAPAFVCIALEVSRRCHYFRHDHCLMCLGLVVQIREMVNWDISSGVSAILTYRRNTPTVGAPTSPNLPRMQFQRVSNTPTNHAEHAHPSISSFGYVLGLIGTVVQEGAEVSPHWLHVAAGITP